MLLIPFSAQRRWPSLSFSPVYPSTRSITSTREFHTTNHVFLWELASPVFTYYPVYHRTSPPRIIICCQGFCRDYLKFLLTGISCRPGDATSSFGITRRCLPSLCDPASLAAKCTLLYLLSMVQLRGQQKLALKDRLSMAQEYSPLGNAPMSSQCKYLRFQQHRLVTGKFAT